MEAFALQDPRHEAARQALLRQYGSPHHNCGVFTRALARQFPELRATAGFYFAPGGAAHGEHWWLETSEGAIVDPTADQWPSQGRGRYERYDPARHLVVKGSCPSCGTGLYSRAGAYPCSRSCDEALAEEYGTRLVGGPYDEEMELACDADVTAKYGLPLPAVPA
jgi:hypothetical protein